MKHKRTIVLRFLTPLLAMMLLAGAVILEKKGISMESRPVLLDLLASQPRAAVEADDETGRFMLVVNGERKSELIYADVITDTLRELRIGCRVADISSSPLPDLSMTDTVLYCSQSLLPLENDIGRLFNWVEAGGHFGIMMTPAADDVFRIIYRKLGIIEFNSEYNNYTSLRYVTDFLPLWGGTVYNQNGELSDYTLPVRLDTGCLVHLETGDESALPLLWETKLGKGRIAVFNASLMGSKSERGFTLAALFALEDTIAYPIINAGMVYIDDFPAPQPEGFNEALLDEYGYDIKGFFRNHWWPDMKLLAWEHGLRFTGVLVETYNDQVAGPFEPMKEADSTLTRFYASELLHSGGELGLHGYNHMPLSPEGFPYLDESYNTWPSAGSMSESLRELVRYGKSFYPEANFKTYVPPSNYLSDTGYKALLDTLPGIKVISGLYLTETGRATLTQEFEETPEGIVSVPRVTSGFAPDDFTRMVMAQELLLHGVFSHFIHPDDILDELRGAKQGWDLLYKTLTEMIISIIETYPELRFSTSSEGAAAIQRFSRLTVTKAEIGDTLKLSLSHFFDEAWLALRTRRTPASISGGEIYKVTDGFYWIRANAPVVQVEWEAAI